MQVNYSICLPCTFAFFIVYWHNGCTVWKCAVNLVQIWWRNMGHMGCFQTLTNIPKQVNKQYFCYFFCNINLNITAQFSQTSVSLLIQKYLAIDNWVMEYVYNSWIFTLIHSLYPSIYFLSNVFMMTRCHFCNWKCHLAEHLFICCDYNNSIHIYVDINHICFNDIATCLWWLASAWLNSSFIPLNLKCTIYESEMAWYFYLSLNMNIYIIYISCIYTLYISYNCIIHISYISYIIHISYICLFSCVEPTLVAMLCNHF